MEHKVKFLRKDAGAAIPERKTPGAAAYDVKIPCEHIVTPGRQVIPLGFAMEIPQGYEAKIEPRSGFSSKGVLGKNGIRYDADVIVGKIDSDYRGIVGVIIKSDEKYPFTIDAGTHIAQLTLYKVEDIEWEVVDELSETQRGDGGFGSTGK